MKTLKTIVFLSGLLAFACTIDNLGEYEGEAKTDYDRYNYVLATEDASDVDITTFFAFNLEDVDPGQTYDLIDQNDIFINSNPSTSSGQVAFKNFIFSQAKDKKGFSSSPGLYRLTLNPDNHIFVDKEINVSRDNLFPARQIAIAHERLGYFYNEGKEAHSIQIFDPSEMVVLGSIDLKPAIEAFRPDAVWEDDSNNNLVRTGSLAMEVKEGKLYVSIAFLETASFNLIADDEEDFYAAVIDIQTSEVEKIITYHGAKTVGFFVSENKATSVDENGNLYFASWGWNQFNAHFPSRVFRIPSGSTDFDQDWKVDIEKHFGPGRIVQSMIAFNNRLYLHVSTDPYGFSDDNPSDSSKMAYYEVDPADPDNLIKLDIPSSDYSSRMNVFSKTEDKLFIAVPNVDKEKFNGFYSIDKSGKLKKEIRIANKFRPTRFYHLHL